MHVFLEYRSFVATYIYGNGINIWQFYSLIKIMLNIKTCNRTCWRIVKYFYYKKLSVYTCYTHIELIFKLITKNSSFHQRVFYLYQSTQISQKPDWSPGCSWYPSSVRSVQSVINQSPMRHQSFTNPSSISHQSVTDQSSIRQSVALIGSSTVPATQKIKWSVLKQ